MITSSYKVPVTLVGFYSNLNFLDSVSIKVQISNFIKIRPVGDELFRAERQTDMAKLKVAFSNIVNAPNNGIIIEMK